MKRTLLSVLLVFLMPMDSQQAGTYPLTLMEESVDDMYNGCTDRMKDEEGNYITADMESNKLFKDAWEMTEGLAKEKSNTRKRLNKEQIHALLVYTQEHPNVYKPFNEAVRTGADAYTGKSFQYYALHYLLTSAIKTLNSQSKGKCETTYRRTTASFVAEEGVEMRFGFFASSSKKSDKKAFGSATCFRIKTCLGAFIQDYSAFKDEEEFLIPPYEKFTITKKEEGSSSTEEGLSDCQTIFVLESKGKWNKLNCMAPEPNLGLFKSAIGKVGSFFKNLG